MKLMIATPTGTGDVCHEYVSSLLASVGDLNARGVAVELTFWPGSCYVALARNELVARFLASDCDRMLFIDADMGGWPADAPWRLIQANRDVVGALYRFKRWEEGYPGWVDTTPEGFPILEHGLVSMGMLPTGFMMLTRDVFDIMKLKYPERQLANKEGEREIWNFFSCDQVNRTWVGEDARFCQLWFECGGRLWAVPDVDFVHVGKIAFAGNWHRYMLRQPGGSEHKEAA